MEAEAVVEPIRNEQLIQEKNEYQNFLRLNYRILQKYEQIHEIFLTMNTIIVNAERDEQQKLEGINAVIASLRNVILSAEKKNEGKLFSD